MGTGTTLELIFSVPVPPGSGGINAKPGVRHVRNPQTTNANMAPALTFTIVEQGTPLGLSGATGLTELADTANASYFLPTSYSGNNGTSSLAVPASWLSG